MYILTEDVKLLDCRMSKNTVSLTIDNKEVARLINIKLLFKKTYNYSMRIGCSRD